MHNNDPLPTVLLSEEYDYARLQIVVRCINCLNLPQQKIAESHFPGSSHQQLWITSFVAIETLLKKCFRNITEITRITRIQLGNDISKLHHFCYGIGAAGQHDFSRGGQNRVH